MRSSALRYTGEQNADDTGLVYLRARWYDPSDGPFQHARSVPGFGGVSAKAAHPNISYDTTPLFESRQGVVFSRVDSKWKCNEFKRAFSCYPNKRSAYWDCHY